MAAYLIASVHVSDPEQFKRYAALTPAIIEQYGGRYLVRNGRYEIVEGAWLGERNVVIEFPDAERARRFFHSPEYTRVKALRIGAADSNGIIIEGV
jgi:uncharacterized protein (DUF1330 family)